MNKLSRAQLDYVALQLQQTKPHQALQAELLDHIASLIEQRMNQGQTFAVAFDQVMQQANPQALDYLKQLYFRELLFRATPAASRVGLRSKRRSAAKPLQYVLLASLFAFLMVMGCLILVSLSLDVPMSAFQTVWGVSITGLAGVFLVRWWLARQLSKPKRVLII